MIGRVVVGAWVLLALAFGGEGGARADNFDFSYQVTGINVTGTFVTTAQGNGRYLITDILNGFRGGNAITLLAPGAINSPFGPSDNALNFPANPGYFTTNGFGYSSDGSNYSTFYYSGTYYDGLAGQEPSEADTVTVTRAAAAPAPHPGGGGLSFLALGLFGLVSRRRVIVGRDHVPFAGLAVSGPAPVPAADGATA